MLASYPHQLSGGQLQRCLIGLSVVMAPDLLITDEPTSAIDKIHQAEILRLLQDVRDRFGTGILCITHEQGLVRAMADREIRLHEPPKAPEAAASRADAAAGECVLEADALVFTHARSGFRGKPSASVGPVSFRLHRGECLGIIGVSGSGKSTLAQMLVGWHVPRSGTLKWRAMPVDMTEPAEVRQLRAHVQLVLQDGRGALHPHFTIRRLFEETGAMRGKNERHHPGRWAEALAEVGLPPDVLDRRSRALSGGECLRVNVARALLLEPDVLVCDESTSALDPDTRDEILRMLSGLKSRRGLAIVFITHDESVLRQLADQLLVLADGKVVEQGRAADVLHYPTHDLTKKMFAAGATFFGHGRH
jgi:ABC-type glutathione transport system ATPase component